MEIGLHNLADVVIKIAERLHEPGNGGVTRRVLILRAGDVTIVVNIGLAA